MRALTLWQPWAWAIASTEIANPKRIENRPWKPPPGIVGKPFAIHAAKSKDLGREAIAAQWIKEQCGLIVPANLIRSAIVAVVTVHTYVTDSKDCWRNPKDAFGWVLSDVQVFDPIPFQSAKGLFMQGLWQMPEALEQQVLQKTLYR